MILEMRYYLTGLDIEVMKIDGSGEYWDAKNKQLYKSNLLNGDFEWVYKPTWRVAPWDLDWNIDPKLEKKVEALAKGIKLVE